MASYIGGLYLSFDSQLLGKRHCVRAVSVALSMHAQYTGTSLHQAVVTRGRLANFVLARTVIKIRRGCQFVFSGIHETGARQRNCTMLPWRPGI